MIDIKINGIKCKVLEGSKILKVATNNCFNIPSRCNGGSCVAGENSINTNCGICVVEVTLNGSSKLVHSCSTEVENGMIINTLSKKVINYRANIVTSMSEW